MSEHTAMASHIACHVLPHQPAHRLRRCLCYNDHKAAELCDVGSAEPRLEPGMQVCNSLCEPMLLLVDLLQFYIRLLYYAAIYERLDVTATGPNCRTLCCACVPVFCASAIPIVCCWVVAESACIRYSILYTVVSSMCTSIIRHQTCGLVTTPAD